MAAKRSYPTSKVRGSGREYQTVTVQEQPRRVTPHPRSGGAAERRYPASEVRGNRREELPHAPKPQARGGRGAMPCPRPGAVAGRTYPMPPRPRPGVAAGRSHPTPEARGGSGEDQPHFQGAVAARAQEGLEKLFLVEGQEQQQ